MEWRDWPPLDVLQLRLVGLLMKLVHRDLFMLPFTFQQKKMGFLK